MPGAEKPKRGGRRGAEQPARTRKSSQPRKPTSTTPVSGSAAATVDDPARRCALLWRLKPAADDAEAVQLLLGDATVSSLAEVARAFGDVTPNTIKTSWRAGGMPGSAGKWPLAAIFLWRLERDLAGGPPTTAKAKQLQERKLAAEAASEEERYTKLQLANRRSLGELYLAADVERNAAALALRIKSRLELIPDQMVLRLPKAQQAQFRRHWSEEIRLVLLELAKWKPF